MKFATLAFLGLVSAHGPPSHDEPWMGKVWRWKHLPGIMRREYEVKEAFEDAMPTFEKKWKQFEKELGERFDEDDYIPLFQEWERSAAVRAKKAHDKRVKNSHLGERLGDAFEDLEDDWKASEWMSGLTHEGYEEAIRVSDFKTLFEDVYEIKEAFKALIESKMSAKNAKLGMAALRDPAFKKIQAQFFEDMGVKSWAEVKQKVQGCIHKMVMKCMSGKCPKLERIVHSLERLIKYAEKTKVEWADDGVAEDLGHWW